MTRKNLNSNRFLRTRPLAKSWSLVLSAALVSSSVALAGCSGSSGDDDDDSSSTSSARKKCNDLTQQFCESAVGCEVEGGLIASGDKDAELASCVSDTTDAAGCADAVDVSSSYDHCMSQLANPPCDEVNQAILDQNLTLPESCNGVILTKN